MADEANAKSKVPADQSKSGGSNKPASAAAAKAAQGKTAREIKGNLPYSASPGSISNVLNAAIEAERPDKFSNNFMETVLSQSGGGARSVPPLLKKMGFLQSDGTPTDLYSKFKTTSGRSEAVYLGMKGAFSEIFRKNEFAHKASEDQLKDLIIEITGLKKNDAVTRHIFNTFNALRSYITDDYEAGKEADYGEDKSNQSRAENDEGTGTSSHPLGLSYHINVVLPETTDPLVFDAIFKSIKRNLL